MMNNNFVLQTSHPLIQSEQTFVLDRKLISIHSVDRDYQKWPNSNHFGIDLGEAFHNVQSMRLINFAVPSNNYTFSTAYQNTKMSFNYIHTYEFELSDWGVASGTGTSNSWEIFYAVMEALWGTSAAGWPNKPTTVAVEFYDNVDETWYDISFPPPGSQSAGPITGSGWDNVNPQKVRFKWTPLEFSITIPEGSYSPDNLTETVQTLMNKEVYNASSGLGFDYILGPSIGQAVVNSSAIVAARTTGSAWNPTNENKGISPFKVYYNTVTNKVLFGVTEGTFTLNFAKQEIYNPSCDVNKAIFHQYTKWGLPAYLGFDKKTYSGTSTDISGVTDPYQQNVGGTGGLYLPFEPNNPWLVPTGRQFVYTGAIANNPGPPITPGTGAVPPPWTTSHTISINAVKQVASIEAEFNLDINGEDALYMEIDRYNSIDEIYPYSERTGHLYNNDLGHRVNGSFAKIPLTHVPFGQEMGSRNNFVLNVFHSDPPIQRIDRLKFTFRYHDGRLVDFKNLPFSFTLEFNMLKDEQERGKHVRVPPLYNL